MALSSLLPIILFSVFFVWLLLLSYFLYKTIHHYNNLTKTTNRTTLTSILDVITNMINVHKNQLFELTKRIKILEKESQFYVQKVGVLRYNPFADTGGEQSFIISLLDNNNSGIILTSLQGRNGTRWYAKQVKQGKGVTFDLSKEEEQAIKKAKKLT